MLVVQEFQKANDAYASSSPASSALKREMPMLSVTRVDEPAMTQFVH